VMPGMSGFELFHALIERTPSLRVLFVSGYIHYTSVEPAMTEKGTAFLEKPFSAEALVRKVRELFNS
jgi:two-component system, cell cycle sensor histidine kinase and response regulator CckA